MVRQLRYAYLRIDNVSADMAEIERYIAQNCSVVSIGQFFAHLSPVYPGENRPNIQDFHCISVNSWGERMKRTFLKRIAEAGCLAAALLLLTACGASGEPAASELVSGPVSEPAAETEADLSNAAILGNSYVDGFVTYNVLPDTDCFYRIGLTVRTVFTKTMLGSEIPVIDELANGKTYDRIFLMFGENELGWPNTQAFYDGYGEVIDAVRERQPEAVIFIQSILPVSAEVSAENIDCTNNEQIVKFNGMLQNLAEEKDAVYLDVASVMADENGCLPDDAATDGIHPGIEYYKKWAEYLKENAVIYKDA